ncbi:MULTISPECIES: hypothetical protein [Dyella]|uniref:Uncharacterized protein n=2 Tax=Dyella TaxID=231454 RepID=A0A4R0YLU3_9GAMM|nr:MULTISPECIES: hypothetical protein [Dyella]TBR36470.1 hypothetical protein EYV96_11025 [Dyella terrae]TCI08438.1 hypothetical protein EZM97_27845 [Dyella soli]
MGKDTMIQSHAFKPALVAALFAVSSSALAQQAPLHPSQINDQPSLYEGRTVTVIGYVTLVPAGHNLYESKELNDQLRRRIKENDRSLNIRDYLKYCLTIANPELLYRNQKAIAGKTLVATGKLITDCRKPGFIDLGACPLSTAIDMGELKRRYPELLRNK